jgi:hypothetical protein
VADRHAAPTLLIGEDDRALSAMLTDLFTDAEPPEDAIPADEAARIILDGVAGGGGGGERIITFPEGLKELWRQYRTSPETVETHLQDLARQSRIAFDPGDAEALYRPARPAAQA